MLAEVGQPAQDHLADVVGQAEALQVVGPGARHLDARVLEMTEHFLDEERVPLRLVVQRARKVGRRRPADPQPDQPRRIALGEAGELDLLQQPLVAQVRDRGREALARLLGRAVGADDRQPARPRRASQVTQQHQRRTVGPVQVVDHDQHRARVRQVAEQSDDGFEQPVALRLGVPLVGRPQLREPPTQHRDQPCELGAVLPHGRAQLVERRLHDVVAESLQERLERDQRLLRSAAREHQRPVRVRALRGLGEQPGLADAGVAAEQQQTFLSMVRVALVSGVGEPPLEVLELGHATDHLRRRQRSELGRQRDRLRRRLGMRGWRPTSAGLGLGRGTQQCLVDRDRLRRGDRAEAPQQGPQLLVDAQPLGDVSLCLERLHQQHVARLAVFSGVDQRPRGPLGGHELSAPECQARAGEHLQRVQADVGQLVAPLVEPGCL